MSNNHCCVKVVATSALAIALAIAADARQEPFVIPGGVEHPRLFLTGDTVRRIADCAGRDARLKAWLDDLGKRSHRAIGGTLSPEPPPIDGLRGPKRGIAYKKIFEEIRPPTEAMEDCALHYAITGDAASGTEAKRRLLHYVAFDPEGSTNTFRNDEPAMSILWKGVRTYDWTFPLYTTEERAVVERVLVARSEAVYRLLRKTKFHENPYESHRGRQIGFLGMACIVLGREHPEMQVWYDYVMRIYRDVYPAWGKEDGGWNEGPHYWSYYMAHAIEYLLAVECAGGGDVLKSKPFFRNTPWYFVYQCPPLSPMSPFGDGEQSRGFASANVRDFADLYRDSALAWFAERYGLPRYSSIASVILSAGGVEPERPSTDIPQTKFFPGVGLVCSHSDIANPSNDVAFYFRSSPYGAVSHGHNDQNTFALCAYGANLAIASGHYNYYGSPHHSKWTRSTRAKCGIVYDDVVSQVRGRDAASEINDFRIDGDTVSFVGDATAAYGGKLGKAVREVVRHGATKFEIRDTLEADEPHVWKYMLHSEKRMLLDEAGQSVAITNGEARLVVRFRVPGGLSFSQTDEFDPPPGEFAIGVKGVRQWHFTGSTVPSKSVTIVSELQVFRSSATTSAVEKDFDSSGCIKSAIVAESTEAQSEDAVCDGKLAGSKIRVGTYNIRNKNCDKGTPNAWEDRKDDLVELIGKIDFDAFGIQEAYPEQVAYIMEHLSQYSCVGEFRNEDRKSGEASPIFYRKERFDEVDGGTFWLSDTPEVPGSISWGAAYTRICSWALLKDRRSSKIFLLANTHADNKSAMAREKGMLLIIRRLREGVRTGTPIVFIGDHNCRETEASAEVVAKIFKNALYLSEASPVGPWRTYNGWKWMDTERTTADALVLPKALRNAREGTIGADKDQNGGFDWQDYGSRIDYIYVSEGVRVLNYETHGDARPNLQLYPSDHFPVSADIVLGPARTVEYAERPGCLLDVRVPAGETNFPTVVWLHGGGLTKGNRHFVPLMDDKIAQVAVGYRLLGKDAVQGGDCIEDAAEAVAWTLRHIGEYGGDSNKVFVSGLSAGGYLTMMVGMDPKYLAAHGVRCTDLAGLVAISGQATKHYAVRKFAGDNDPQYLPKIDDLAPLAHVAANLPPILCVCGQPPYEWKCRSEENRLLIASCVALGHKRARFVELDYCDHGRVYDAAMPYLEMYIRGKLP